MTVEQKIIEWAKDKNLINPENAKTQLLKSFEEMGELAEGILKDDKDLIIDAIGDVMVTLIILARIKGINLDTCLHYAWHEIKNRKGKTVNGTFIKDIIVDVQDKKDDDTIDILRKWTKDYMLKNGIKSSKLNNNQQLNPFPISYGSLSKFLYKGHLSLKQQVLMIDFFGHAYEMKICKKDKK